LEPYYASSVLERIFKLLSPIEINGEQEYKILEILIIGCHIVITIPHPLVKL